MSLIQLANYLPLMVIAAILFDCVCGEPRHYHPLVGFGNLARQIERKIYPTGRASVASQMIRGIAAVLLALLPWLMLALWLGSYPLIDGIFSVLLLYFAIAPRSLREHGMRVFAALQANDLPAARTAVSMMVSRNTEQLDEAGVARAAVESVLENGNDAIFGALFWFVIAGAPGVLLYRLSNTLDAMWGYRNARYDHFGWAAARLDDVLNYIPARLTAFSYALLGQTCSAWQCWLQQAATWDSPNAGPVMAAGAGALQVKLGGAASYHGVMEVRPLLGCGEEVSAHDISRAIVLVQHTLVLWCVFIVAVVALLE